MGFDNGGWPAKCGYRFNDIWIERSLGKEFNPFSLIGFSLKDLNKDLADDFSLFSGSVIFFSGLKNLFCAFTNRMLILRCCLNALFNFSASSILRRPLSTKMQVRRFPTALWSNTAVTEESTPPLSPKIIFLQPTRSFIRAIESLTKDGIVQEG